jgi:thiamine biosynthesis protein ThiS
LVVGGWGSVVGGQVMTITLNGEPFELEQPITLADLLKKLDIDARRVAIEHNLVIVRRQLYEESFVHEGDRVEIVNFVGGG